MPPKKDKVETNQPNKDGTGKKPRKKYKTRKKKDDCPSRARKTDRVVINKQARDMIAKVYEFMKHEASSEYAEKLTNARWRCAHACGVSEKTVTRILKEKRKAVAAAAGGAIGAVPSGKIGLENTGNINEAAHVHLTGALSNMSKGVSNMVPSDLQGVGILATGASVVGGHLLGPLVGGPGKLMGTGGQSVGLLSDVKLGAVKELGEHVNNVAAGNYGGVGTNLGNTGGQVLNHDVQGADVLVNAADGFFRHSVFDY